MTDSHLPIRTTQRRRLHGHTFGDDISIDCT
jgi:hypothetical protein